MVHFLSVPIKTFWKLLASATVFQLMTDGTKLDNGFIELIDHAITHHYPTLEFLSTSRSTFVEGMIQKYEHIILQTIKILRPMTFETCIATMSILDRERRKRRDKGQVKAQVSFEAAKRALIGYYYRCR